MAERILLLGDTEGIKVQDIRAFMKTVNCLYGGSFPNHREGLSATTVVEETCGFLAEVGIKDPTPLVICGSTQERAEQILQLCALHRKQHGEGLYLILDSNPHALAESAELIATNDNGIPQDILKSITIINLGTKQSFDQIDQETRLRIVYLPHPVIPFPIHTTPAT